LTPSGHKQRFRRGKKGKKQKGEGFEENSQKKRLENQSAGGPEFGLSKILPLSKSDKTNKFRDS